MKKFISYNKNKLVKILSTCEFEILNSEDTVIETNDYIDINQKILNKNKGIRLAYICNWNQQCGISTYSKFVLDELKFMVDEYQFYEAKSIGADVVLLIAACLSPSQVQEFTALAHELNLEVLLEIHTEEELEHFNSEIDLVGINNRNLKDFKVDLQHSVNLKNLLPKGTLSVAESGIYNVEDFKFLKEKGFDAFLMGEYFMKNENPGNKFKEFVDVII